MVKKIAIYLFCMIFFICCNYRVELNEIQGIYYTYYVGFSDDWYGKRIFKMLIIKGDKLMFDDTEYHDIKTLRMGAYNSKEMVINMIQLKNNRISDISTTHLLQINRYSGLGKEDIVNYYNFKIIKKTNKIILYDPVLNVTYYRLEDE